MQGLYDENTMVNFGLQYGTKVLHQSEERFLKFLPGTSGLRRYFKVDNSYVKVKLGMLFFPFSSKRFERLHIGGGAVGGGDGFETPGMMMGGGSPTDAQGPSPASGTTVAGAHYTPIEDNAVPDLYIPLMAVITYVTLCAFVHGLRSHLVDPQELVSTMMLCGAVLVTEAAVLKMARYALMLGGYVVPMLDAVGTFGYKFVGICLCVLIRAVLNLDSFFFSALVILVAAVFAFFVYRALGELMRKIGDSHPPKRVLPILYGAAAIQVPLFMYFSSRPF